MQQLCQGEHALADAVEGKRHLIRRLAHALQQSHDRVERTGACGSCARVEALLARAEGSAFASDAFHDALDVLSSLRVAHVEARGWHKDAGTDELPDLKEQCLNKLSLCNRIQRDGVHVDVCDRSAKGDATVQRLLSDLCCIGQQLRPRGLRNADLSLVSSACLVRVQQQHPITGHLLAIWQPTPQLARAHQVWMLDGHRPVLVALLHALVQAFEALTDGCADRVRRLGKGGCAEHSRCGAIRTASNRPHHCSACSKHHVSNRHQLLSGNWKLIKTGQFLEPGAQRA
mmetsp:Transcript_25476/g.80021  ORF Transcript_25476/g.80021 Transcript_25476/m.80021 type:complete len:287 (+) Transcript_25476:1272-2132(+)